MLVPSLNTAHSVGDGSNGSSVSPTHAHTLPPSIARIAQASASSLDLLTTTRPLLSANGFHGMMDREGRTHTMK